MKKLAFYCLLSLACISIIYACKKTETKPAPVPDFNKSNNGCLLSEATDASIGIDFPITYNAKGDPATFAGSAISYDSKSRLSKIQYSSARYREWVYNDNTFLPSRSNFYSDGGLAGTIIYTYDSSGRIIKYDAIYTSSENVWQINYDTKSNVSTIIVADEKGPISGFGVGDTVYKAKSYDGKPNFANANQWVKYMLPLPEMGYFLNIYLVFSANNATEWSVNDRFNAFIFHSEQAFYQYNNKGFAVKDSIISKDPVYGDYTDVQVNSFNCQ